MSYQTELSKYKNTQGDEGVNKVEPCCTNQEETESAFTDAYLPTRGSTGGGERTGGSITAADSTWVLGRGEGGVPGSSSHAQSQTRWYQAGEQRFNVSRCGLAPPNGSPGSMKGF